VDRVWHAQLGDVAVKRIAILVFLVACHADDGVFGPPTESVCPQGSTLTYENFGKPFMENYCTRCHSSELRGAARMGAPSFHDFDTLFGIQVVADHVDETSAAGPAATNRGMPPGRPSPTLEERKKLGEWIACGMPSSAAPP
jgi:hypothetical protein